jgi:hypothetical protein
LKALAPAAIGLGLAALLATRPAPANERDEAALLGDLEKIVAAQQSTGWQIDRYELEAMLPDALESVCEAMPQTRATLLHRLGRRMDLMGGPVHVAYRRNGNDLSSLGDLLFLSRVHALLVASVERGAAECPFWIEPTPEFAGLQTAATASR